MTHPAAPVPMARPDKRDSIVWWVTAPLLIMAVILQMFLASLLQINVGTLVRISTVPAPRGAGGGSGTLVLTAITERGPVGEPIHLSSMADYNRKCGGRSGAATAYDGLEWGWGRGLGEVVLSRVASGAATTATAALTDDAVPPVPMLNIDANGPGDAGNRLAVEVTAGSTADLRTIVVTDDGDVVETHVDVSATDHATTVARLADKSDYIRGRVAGEGAIVVTGPVQLAGGDDDLAGIDDDAWAAALDVLGPDVGGLQVAAYGRTTTAAHRQLTAHAEQTRRAALLDLPDGADEATMRGLADAIEDDDNAHCGGLFGVWIDIPGLVPDTWRSVPPSALVAARIAANDQVTHTNASPAADQGRLVGYAGDRRARVRQTFSDEAWDRLYGDGVNLVRADDDGVYLATFRSVATQKFWRQLNNWRYVASKWHGLNALIRQFNERTINAESIGEAETAIVDDLMGDVRRGALTPGANAPAFTVDMGDTVNTDDSRAEGEFRARVGLSPSTVGVTFVLDLAVSEPGRGVTG